MRLRWYMFCTIITTAWKEHHIRKYWQNMRTAAEQWGECFLGGGRGKF